MKKMNIFEKLESFLSKKFMPRKAKENLLKKLEELRNKKINILITGATGSGKSSTINAMFNADVAKVGVGVDPETMDIKKFELDNLTIWDSPGLGDGKENDIRHSKAIIKKLNELDENNNPLIDVVLVILDAGTRDMGTAYELINKIIIPNLGKEKDNRIIVALNQADTAMYTRGWNFEENRPEKELEEFLDKKVESIKLRIKASTNLDIEPIYYSAGYKDEGEEQKPWNLIKLLELIVSITPAEKRLSYVDNISQDQGVWQHDDGLKDYAKSVQNNILYKFVNYAKKQIEKFADEVSEGFGNGLDQGSDTGAEIGRGIGDAIGSELVGDIGEIVLGGMGGVVGGITGAVSSVVSGIGSCISSVFGW